MKFLFKIHLPLRLFSSFMHHVLKLKKNALLITGSLKENSNYEERFNLSPGSSKLPRE